MGVCQMYCTDLQIVTLKSDTEQLPKLQQVVSDHLLRMAGGGYGLTAFGFDIFAEGEKVAWAATLGQLHAPLAWMLTALIIVHTAMALYHHYIKKDNTLKRML